MNKRIGRFFAIYLPDLILIVILVWLHIQIVIPLEEIGATIVGTMYAYLTVAFWSVMLQDAPQSKPVIYMVMILACASIITCLFALNQSSKDSGMWLPIGCVITSTIVLCFCIRRLKKLKRGRGRILDSTV